MQALEAEPSLEADPSLEQAAIVRLRLELAYDGTDFSGWASQPGRRTVQSTVQDALSMVLRVPDIRLTVAGRTDAGVHARGQVCHLDVPAESVAATGVALDRLTSRLARVLPDDVRVRSVVPAAPGFDARFSASWRRYSYLICDNPSNSDPLARRQTVDWPHRIDEEAMNAAAASLVGEHDFAAFCKRREGATTVRELREFEWNRQDDLLTARVVADAFCHHMVRALVGALLVVGQGRQPAGWPADVLSGGQRDPRVGVAPARGLTLEEVGYPDDAELAARARQARAVRTLI